MPREDVDARGRRLLAEGRLTVRLVGVATISATCRGDSGDVHKVGYAAGAWSCDCPARTRCAHLVALQLVTLRPTRTVA